MSASGSLAPVGVAWKGDQMGRMARVSEATDWWKGTGLDPDRFLSSCTISLISLTGLFASEALTCLPSTRDRYICALG